MLKFFRIRSNPKIIEASDNIETVEEPPPREVTKDDLAAYRAALGRMDAATCEAIAVSQHTAHRFVAATIGYSTHISTRMCINAQQMMCVLPKSRWFTRDFETWDISCIAPYARSILEGYLLFRYLIDAPSDRGAQRAYVQVMHMYDCKRRQEILKHSLSEEEKAWFKEQEAEIRGRLEGISYFTELDEKTKKSLLQGKHLMITDRSELVSKIGLNQDDFDRVWNYLSQYSHMFSFTFYRMEPDGRGTGILNPSDINALTWVINFTSDLMNSATSRIIEEFPDAASVKDGTNSKFAPGPRRNLPKHLKRKSKN